MILLYLSEDGAKDLLVVVNNLGLRLEAKLDAVLHHLDPDPLLPQIPVHRSNIRNM
jgi:hypothetical protein